MNLFDWRGGRRYHLSETSVTWSGHHGQEESDLVTPSDVTLGSLPRKVFPIAIPTSAEWTELEDIRCVLDAIAGESATLLAGLNADCFRAVRSEKGFIELLGEKTVFAIQAVRLEFDHFPESPAASYFRLLAAKHPAPNADPRSGKKVKWDDENLLRREAQAGGFAFFRERHPYLESVHRHKDYQSSKSRSKFRELMKSPRRAKPSDSSWF